MLGLVNKVQNKRAAGGIIAMLKGFVMQVKNGDTTLSLMTLSIMSHSVVLLSITIKSDAQHSSTQYCYDEYHLR